MTRRATMVTLAEEYLAYRRGLGFALQTAGQLLLGFATYADRAGHRGPLTTALAVRWARLPRGASPVYWARRLDVVRGFARYRALSDPATEIPPQGILGPAYRRVTPHIYSQAELADLLAAARRLSPGTGLRPHTYATLFGLIACTGLRLSEALGLNRSDVDWQRGLLTVRQSKFRKSRLVPLHASATQALQAYADRRDRLRPGATEEAFFVTGRGTRLCRATAEGTFRGLRAQLSWPAAGGRRGPRIHDLRHTFACRRLQRWYEQGVAVDQAIAALSTYLGHTTIRDTYWYLTGVPELLELAAARFRRFAAPDPGGQP
jgi:integrase